MGSNNLFLAGLGELLEVAPTASVYVDLDGHQQGDKAWLEPAKEYINSLFRSFSKKTDPDPQPAEIRPGPSVDREWISIRPGLGLRRLTG